MVERAMTTLQLGVPAELLEQRRWVCWREVPQQDDKPRKMPIRAATGAAASTTDAATWCTHAEALAGAERHNVTGLGVVLTEGELVGIDLDAVRDPTTGRLLPWAAQLLEVWGWEDAWVEVSHSGTGLHAVVRGSVRDAWAHQVRHPDGGSCEVYGHGRYFVVTGNCLHMPRQLPQLDAMPRTLQWLDRMMQRPASAAVQRVMAQVQLQAPGDSAYGLTALHDECVTLSTTQHGGRNNALNLATLKVAQLVAGGELTAATAQRELVTAARACGLGDAEIAGTMRSAWQAGTQKPRSAPELHMRHAEAQPARRQPQAEQAPRTPLAQRIEQAQADNRATQGWQHRGIVMPQYPALTDALDGISGWCLLTGGTGVGKTTTTLAAALSVAMRGRIASPSSAHAGGADPDARQADKAAHSAYADVVYLSTEMTWAEQYHAMVCMLAGVWWRDYTTRRSSLLPQRLEALERAEQTLGALMREGRLHLLSASDVCWDWQPDWKHAMHGVQDAVEELTHGARTLLVVDTLATLPVRPAEFDPRGIDSLQRDELVVEACTQLRQRLEATHSAMLTVTEEAKHLTGTADMHSARGSAAYTYRASQRLALVSATAERTGSRTLGVRRCDPTPDCSEVDMHILKARQGGHGGAVVPMSHAYTRNRLEELTEGELEWGAAPRHPDAHAYWTASQLRVARMSKDARERRKDEAANT
jgi:hypothetical protein